MHSIKSRFVIGPSDILFAGVYVSVFQPGNFTGCGSEGVNILHVNFPSIVSVYFVYCLLQHIPLKQKPV